MHDQLLCDMLQLKTRDAHHRATTGRAGSRRIPAAFRGLRGKTLTTELTLLQGYVKIYIYIYTMASLTALEPYELYRPSSHMEACQNRSHNF